MNLSIPHCLEYRIDSGTRDTSVSAIALVFFFFSISTTTFLLGFSQNDWPAVKKNKKNGAIPQNGSVSYTRVNTVVPRIEQHSMFFPAYDFPSLDDGRRWATVLSKSDFMHAFL
jgi:hypothetical protein